MKKQEDSKISQTNYPHVRQVKIGQCIYSRDKDFKECEFKLPELYNSLGWKKYEFEILCRAIGRTRTTGLKGEGTLKKIGKRIEYVWVNYEPTQLKLFKEEL